MTLTELARPIRRRIEIDGQDFRVEVSPYGVALYVLGGRKPLWDASWDRLLQYAERRGNSRNGGRRVDPWVHIQRIYVELDAIVAELRNLRREVSQ